MLREGGTRKVEGLGTGDLDLVGVARGSEGGLAWMGL